MRKVAVLILGAILLHALFGDFNAFKIFLLLGALVLAYVLYEVPDRLILAAKYPTVILSLMGAVLSVIYPRVVSAYQLQQVLLLLSFYSLGFYLSTMESKGQHLVKEIVALSLLMVSASANCYAAGQPLAVLPLALATTCLLFVIGRARLLPVVWSVCGAMLVVVYLKGLPMLGTAYGLPDLERYVLLGTTFFAFLFSFVLFVREGDTLKLLGFYAFLFLSFDILLALTVRLPATLLYQPLLAILLVAPSLATLMKSAGRRA
jgi:hypothetical protein